MYKTIIVLTAVVMLFSVPASAERWPMGPGDEPQRVGNNCYEFQDYGGGAYYHDGIDVLNSGGDPIYSVDDTYMRLISVSDPYYTGMITSYEKDGSDDRGWLYWHITYSTIPFIEGDFVPVDAYMGNIATWPVSEFHHVHFTRGEYVGGWYECIDNAIDFMDPPADDQEPVFHEAETDQMFSFCEDNSTIQVDPGEVAGEVDIIANISDKIVDTYWDVVPYEIVWWVEGDGGSVPETLFIVFTGPCPAESTVTGVVYKRAGIWWTEGDYDARDYYFVITNTDGDGFAEDEDAAYYFDSTLLPDGDYTLYVRARDFYGNEVTESMDFTINNEAPAAFDLISPEDGTIVEEPVTLDWEDSADKRAGLSERTHAKSKVLGDARAITYDVWYSTNDDFDPYEEINDLTESTYTFEEGDFEPGETYYWKVRAYDGLYETWSGPDEYWSFTIKDPYTDVNVTSFSAEAVSDGIAVTWECDDSAAGFNLYRSSKTDSASLKTITSRDRLNAELIAGESPYEYLDATVEKDVTYNYWLEALDVGGSSETFGPVECIWHGVLPTTYALYQSRPNPAPGTATIAFDLPETAPVTLIVYDISGRKVTTVVDETLTAGEREAEVSGLAPGVYVYRLKAGDFNAARKMVIVE
jgi:hypothetical protein